MLVIRHFLGLIFHIIEVTNVSKRWLKIWLGIWEYIANSSTGQPKLTQFNCCEPWFQNKCCTDQSLGLGGCWMVLGLLEYILLLWSCWFLFLVCNLSSHLNLTFLSNENFNPCRLLFLDMLRFIFWLQRWRQSWVVGDFHFNYKFRIFSVDDHVFT